jgi:hypothetical protein
MPIYLNDDGSAEYEHGVLPAGHRALTTTKSVATITELLDKVKAKVQS